MSDSLAEQIAKLERIQAAAVTSTSVDGVSASIDQATAARSLRERRRRQAAEQGLPDPRPVVSTIKLS